MGSKMLLEVPNSKFLLIFIKIWVHFSCSFQKLMGSGTHCSKIDGFPGTRGTHANGANAYQTTIFNVVDFFWDRNKNCSREITFRIFLLLRQKVSTYQWVSKRMALFSQSKCFPRSFGHYKHMDKPHWWPVLKLLYILPLYLPKFR